MILNRNYNLNDYIFHKKELLLGLLYCKEKHNDENLPIDEIDS